VDLSLTQAAKYVVDLTQRPKYVVD